MLQRRGYRNYNIIGNNDHSNAAKLNNSYSWNRSNLHNNRWRCDRSHSRYLQHNKSKHYRNDWRDQRVSFLRIFIFDFGLRCRIRCNRNCFIRRRFKTASPRHKQNDHTTTERIHYPTRCSRRSSREQPAHDKIPRLPFELRAYPD